MAECVRALDRRPGCPGFDPTSATLLHNFGNSVYPTLPVSFGEDTKCRRSLLSGGYAGESKRSHRSGKCVCNLSCMDSTTLGEGEL